MKNASIVIGIVSLAAVPFAAFAQNMAPTLTTNASASITARVASTSVSARTNAGVSGTAKTNRIFAAKQRADEEIVRRIGNLTKVETRIQNAAHISDSDKVDLSTTLAAQISAMQTLENQIASDTSTTSVRADIQSITKSYRIYALVIPQSAIIAAADRVNDVVSLMNSLAEKIQARLSAASNSGASVAFADMQAKVSDAGTQSSAAVSEVVSLKPDNGDVSVKASNTAALKDARSKIQTAQQDLVAARKDVTTILGLLKANASTNVSASTSASASAR